MFFAQFWTNLFDTSAFETVHVMLFNEFDKDTLKYQTNQKVNKTWIIK